MILEAPTSTPEALDGGDDFVPSVEGASALIPRKGPKQKPGKSRQDYATPGEFVEAVARRLGHPFIDLAASASNAKAGRFITAEKDSLVQPWADILNDEVTYAGYAVAWLNPPFANLDDWARKGAHESALMHPRATVAMLCPASVGTNWWSAHVDCHAAEVLFLSPRITFVGEKDAYPKDLALIIYRGEVDGGTMYRPWRWKP